MRAVNARLDLSRVSVFHAVGTRRGIHRARGSLCALLRATGLILEISFWPAARSARGRGELARAPRFFSTVLKLYTSNALSSLITWTHPWAFSA
jgi:hypothetical protein